MSQGPMSATDGLNVVSDNDQRVAELEAEVKSLRQDLQQVVKRVHALEQGQGSGCSDSEDAEHSLAAYAGMPKDKREEVLGERNRSKLRAVTLYQSWDTIAWKMGDSDNRRYGIDTSTETNKKHNPSKAKVELETLFGQELASNEIYRLMRQVALLSGGEETVDQFGRTHIAGGEFEYHEMPVPDASKTKRVLYRKDEWSP